MNTDATFVKAMIAFAHPIVMLGTLISALYALYLGIQVRRSRTADKELKKELIKGRYNQRHFQLGSLLLTFWIVGGLGGMAATYTLYHKLFVSPHLLLGLSSVAVVALAAALVPLMQQGKEWARLTHIAFTMTLVGLTLAQTATGFQIVQKLFREFSGAA
jgi:Ca2+/Na+ antiporter